MILLNAFSYYDRASYSAGVVRGMLVMKTQKCIAIIAQNHTENE